MVYESTCSSVGEDESRHQAQGDAGTEGAITGSRCDDPSQEEWRPVVGWESRYEVSNLGRVRSLPRYVSLVRKVRYYPPSIMKLSKGGHGYSVLNLCDRSRYEHSKVHQLVAKAFLPNPLGLPWINHIDGFKSNNAVSNLEWCTPSYNIAHAYRTGLQKLRKGEQSGAAKITESDVFRIRELRALGVSVKDISQQLALPSGSVHGVIYRKAWTHV